MTPCLSALKSYCPDVEITIVTEAKAAPILEDHPLVDRLAIAGPTTLSRVSLVRHLRAIGLDVAFNMHGGTTATFITALSGAPHRIGYRDYRYSWMLNARAPAPDTLLGRTKLHSVEQQLALLTWAGVPYPDSTPRLCLPVSDSAKSTVAERLAAAGLEPSGFVVLAPAASHESKRWPAACFADVIDHLWDYWRMPAVVIAGDGEEQVAEHVAASARTTPTVLTKLTLRELIALISSSRLFFGNDGGPMHIAAALERPIVAVFRSSNADVWHPWTPSPCHVLRAAHHGVDLFGEIPLRDALDAVDQVVESVVSASNG